MKSYLKPELIDLTGFETFGVCGGNGSGDFQKGHADDNNVAEMGSPDCNQNGGMADAFCNFVGHMATVATTP